MAEIYSRFGIFIILVIAVIVASFLSDAFFTTRNLSNIIRQNAVIMIIAFGSQMVLITGGCDLSPGSVCALSGVISTMVMVSTGNPVISLVVGILIGAFCGFINGLVITSCGIPDFIMTLASQFICRGAVLAITQAQPISGFDESYTVFGQGICWPDSGPDYYFDLSTHFLLGSDEPPPLRALRIRSGRKHGCGESFRYQYEDS